MLEQTPVQNPLTLIMKIKSESDFKQLNQKLREIQSLPSNENPITVALSEIATVHFARFTFLDNNTKLAVITSFDGDFDRYIMDFVEHIGDVFNTLLIHMENAPPLPVQEHHKDFLKYVKNNDVPSLQPFYSAYPNLTVLDILALANEHQ